MLSAWGNFCVGNNGPCLPGPLGLYKGRVRHNNIHSVSLMIFSGTRLNAEKTDLSAILPEEVEEEVKAAAEISMGTEVF